MSRTVKRTRTTAKKSAASSITIKPHVDSGGYASYLVQGWKEDNKWKRKQFKDRQKAETFAALKRVEMENQGRTQRMVLSHLTDEQHEEALRAFDRLGATYSLSSAVEYFLRHHRPPEFTIRLSDAIKLYLDDKERDGIRSRSLGAIKSVLQHFSTQTDNPFAHEITAGVVEAFLRTLRAKDGTHKATRKTWNNYRNDLGGFLGWCATPDSASNRPFLFENPVPSVRKFTARQVREDQKAKPDTTSPADTQRLFSALMRWRNGAMVRPFALLYFAGIRPGELERLAGREGELLNLHTRTLTIPANVAKTRHERHVTISDNLFEWLTKFPGPIVPVNYDRLSKRVRKHFGLTHDQARHSYISYHVALHRSIGDAALQAGNSESIVKRHYLNTHSKTEGANFFSIRPNLEMCRAHIPTEVLVSENLGLKAI